jgi:hypothetical protein
MTMSVHRLPRTAPVPWKPVSNAEGGKRRDFGRDCREASHEDLEAGVVDVGGILICSACAVARRGPTPEDHHRAGPTTALTGERSAGVVPTE